MRIFSVLTLTWPGSGGIVSVVAPGRSPGRQRIPATGLLRRFQVLRATGTEEHASVGRSGLAHGPATHRHAESDLSSQETMI